MQSVHRSLPAYIYLPLFAMIHPPPSNMKDNIKHDKKVTKLLSSTKRIVINITVVQNNKELKLLPPIIMADFNHFERSEKYYIIVACVPRSTSTKQELHYNA